MYLCHVLMCSIGAALGPQLSCRLSDLCTMAAVLARASGKTSTAHGSTALAAMVGDQCVLTQRKFAVTGTLGELGGKTLNFALQRCFPLTMAMLDVTDLVMPTTVGCCKSRNYQQVRCYLASQCSSMRPEGFAPGDWKRSQRQRERTRARPDVVSCYP